MIPVGSIGESLPDLHCIVANKTKTYDPDTGQDGEAEFDTTEKIGWWGMVGRESSVADKIKFCVGNFAAIVVGAALPGFMVIFGEMVDGIA
jgi:hypothetical protein